VRYERIVIAAPAEEEHTLPALMMTYLLRRHGWNVVYLGADVPLQDFRSTIEVLHTNLVIMLAQQLSTAATLLDHANIVSQLQIRLAFGGLIFNRIPFLRERIPGHFLGKDLKDSIATIEEIISNPSEPIEIPSQSPSSFQDHFQARMPMIDSRLHQSLSSHPELSSVPGQHLSRNILAALKFGDISIVNNDLVWIHGMLEYLQMPSQAMVNFLEIYAEMVDEVIGSEGEPVLNWLQGEIDKFMKNEK